MASKKPKPAKKPAKPSGPQPGVKKKRTTPVPKMAGY